MDKKTRSNSPEEVSLLCPICGRELEASHLKKEGWECVCGEFIPKGLVIDPFEGCTHGKGCNCGRERRGVA